MSIQTQIDILQKLYSKNKYEYVIQFNEFINSKYAQMIKERDSKTIQNLINQYNRFCLYNGLINERHLMLSDLINSTKNNIDETNLFIYLVLTNNITTENVKKLNNFHYKLILLNIMQNFKTPIENYTLDKLNFAHDYYSDAISYTSKKEYKKQFKETPQYLARPQVKINTEIIPKLITIGEFVRYDCKYFYDSELLYLLCGLAIVNAKNVDINSFDDLFNYIYGFLQLLPFNKVFKPTIFKNEAQPEYNLTTFIKNKNHYNYRYKMCEKYIEDRPTTKPTDPLKDDDNANKNRTKLIQTQSDIYIQTTIKLEEVDEIYAKLNDFYQVYMNDSTIENLMELYKQFVCNQLLTRSSCLFGLLMVNILQFINNKPFIKPLKDQQLDWCAILNPDKINECYELVDMKVDFSLDKLRVMDMLCYSEYYSTLK